MLRTVPGPNYVVLPEGTVISEEDFLNSDNLETDSRRAVESRIGSEEFESARGAGNVSGGACWKLDRSSWRRIPQRRLQVQVRHGGTSSG